VIVPENVVLSEALPWLTSSIVGSVIAILPPDTVTVAVTGPLPVDPYIVGRVPTLSYRVTYSCPAEGLLLAALTTVYEPLAVGNLPNIISRVIFVLPEVAYAAMISADDDAVTESATKDVPLNDQLLATTVIVKLLLAVLPPLVTVRLPVYVPAVVYVWLAVCPDPLLPSPKFQL
jgi:hypothetical protein